MRIRNGRIQAQPGELVVLSFLSAILAGTVLLKLPVSNREGYLSWIDALFTSTSAVCVTGLVVVDTGSHFTRFGQSVILGLVELGGLGVMTISVALFKLTGRVLSIRYRRVVQETFAHTPRNDIFNLLKHVFLLTFCTQLAGALVLSLCWWNSMPPGDALFHGIFHSISAFCNAGFSLFPDSLISYRDHLVLNLAFCTLIITGGLGFPVLYECIDWLRRGAPRRCRFSLQSKAVLWTSLLLTLAGALMFALLEHNRLAQAGSLPRGLVEAIFQSVTCRTAGFNTIDIARLKEATLMMMIFLMFVGASPGSCGGGVKTTTLALLAAFTISKITRRKRVTLFRRSVSDSAVARSLALVLVAGTLIAVVVFLLLVDDAIGGHVLMARQGDLLAYLFETVSAFATVGLSMGITAQLDAWGKFLMIIMMLVGRVGVLTFAYLLIGSGKTRGIEYAEENMMVG